MQKLVKKIKYKNSKIQCIRLRYNKLNKLKRNEYRRKYVYNIKIKYISYYDLYIKQHKLSIQILQEIGHLSVSTIFI